MTATDERQSAPSRPGAPDWAERSLFGTNRGIPLWGAILLAALATAFGAALDLLIWNAPGLMTQACYFVACVLAVALVQRRSLFGPMVQTPLVVSVIVPLITLLGGQSGGSGAGKAIAIAQPLISNFPMMAVTTGVALVLGLVRMFLLQRSEAAREDGEAATKKARPRTAAASPSGSAKRPGEADRKRPPAQAARREQAARGERAARGEQADRGKQQAPPTGSKSGRSDRGRGAAPPDGRGAKDQGGRSRGQAPERNRGAPRQEPPRDGQGRGGQGRGGQPRENQGRGGQPREGQGRGGQGRGGQGRGREGRPQRDERGNPPGRGAPRRDQQGDQGRSNRGSSPNQGRGRPAPGRGRPQDPNRGGEQPPQRRPRKPRRDDFPG